jgi:hypothetical protein
VLNFDSSRAELKNQVADALASGDAAAMKATLEENLRTSSGRADAQDYDSWRAANVIGGRTTVGCVVVTGPGIRVQDGWMGLPPEGVLLKRPLSSGAGDAMAIDGTLTSVDHTALMAARVGDAVPFAGGSSGYCGDGRTFAKESLYVVEARPRSNQKHPLTGEVDTSIDGRETFWDRGTVRAPFAPDATMARALAAKPSLTFHVIDSAGVLRLRVSARVLGELPPAELAEQLVATKQLPQLDRATLARWLDLEAGGPDVSDDIGLASAAWTQERYAFTADRFEVRAEVYASTPGRGLRGPASRWPENTEQSPDPLWSAASRDAPALDNRTGVNFEWQDTALAAEPSDAGCGVGLGPTRLMSRRSSMGIGARTTGFLVTKPSIPAGQACVRCGSGPVSAPLAPPYSSARSRCARGPTRTSESSSRCRTRRSAGRRSAAERPAP